MDYHPPAFSVHGILQARILEWVAISSSRDFPDPGIEPMYPAAPALQAVAVPSEKPGKPSFTNTEGQIYLINVLPSHTWL